MAMLRTGPGERGGGELVEGSGEGLINRLFSHSHQTQQQGACFPLLQDELKSAQGGRALEWQVPAPKPAQSPASPHRAGLRKEEVGNSSIAHTGI